jgi:hypothetical protein
MLNWTRATPNTTCVAEWQTTLDRSTGFSAACYFYAQELHQNLGGVPVGAIDTVWTAVRTPFISAVCAVFLTWTCRWVWVRVWSRDSICASMCKFSRGLFRFRNGSASTVYRFIPTLP